MILSGINTLSFDTGGPVFDWHTGFGEAFAEAGSRRGIDRDWTRRGKYFFGSQSL